MPKVHGADVSHHQGGLDLPQAKTAGLKFLYHKVTEGDTFVDPEYKQRRANARKAGLPFGAYHFARAEYLKGKPDAKAEARRFIKLADPKPGDLVPALDLETAEGLTQGQLKTWARIFADEVEELIGVRPVLYSPWELGLGLVRWVPRYNDSSTPPVIPWDIWQFSNGDLGKPDSFPGLGHVDLNTFSPKFGLNGILIPEKREPKPERKTRRLTFQHTSMQFSDTDDQMRSDVEKIFSRGRDILTGTEAGGQKSKPLPDILRAAGKKHGYRVHIARGDWIAVSKDLVTDGWNEGFIPVIDSSEGAGKHTDRGVVWAAFNTEELGRIHVAAGHYLTKGRRKGDPNYELNRRFAAALGDWARKVGKGPDLAFYGGDQNIVDRDNDTFHGEPLTSLWDEVGRYENTGHGNIDVIASYDRDGRVVGRSIRALDDSELHLHTDHFLVQGAFDVGVLKR